MQLQNFYAQDVNGNIVPGAVCTLFIAGTPTLATGLQDANGVALSNPFSANSIGLASVAAPQGVYDLQIASGLLSSKIRIQFIDVAQVSADAASAAASAASAADSAESVLGIIDTLQPLIPPGSTGQFYAADKTFKLVTKAGVGLSNVDDTSDLNKPVSTATQSAISAATSKVSSISAIRTLDRTQVKTTRALGYYAPGDGGNGDFYLDESDSTSVDNGGSIIVNPTDGGRWKIVQSYPMCFRQWGVKFDGSNETARVNAAIFGAPGGEIKVGAGIVNVDFLNPASNTTIIGSSKNRSTIQRTASTTASTLFDASGITAFNFQDVTLHGNKASNSNVCYGVSYGAGCFNISLTRASIVNFLTGGLTSSTSADTANQTYFNLIDVDVTDNGGVGINISKCNKVRMDKVYSLRNSAAGCSISNYVFPPVPYSDRDYTVSNSYFEDNGGSGFSIVGSMVVGSTSGKPVYGTNPPINDQVTLTNVHANRNSLYGIIVQADHITLNAVEAMDNGDKASPILGALAGINTLCSHLVINGARVRYHSGFGIDSGGAQGGTLTGIMLDCNVGAGPLSNFTALNLGAASNLQVSGLVSKLSNSVANGTHVLIPGIDGDGAVPFPFGGYGVSISGAVIELGAAHAGVKFHRLANLGSVTDCTFSGGTAANAIINETPYALTERGNRSSAVPSCTLDVTSSGANLVIPDWGDSFKVTGAGPINYILSTSASAIFNQVLDGVITNQGSGYVTKPAVTISGGGTGASATAEMTNDGKIIGLFWVSHGTGYTSTPTITIAAPPSGVTATATAIIGANNMAGRTIKLYFNGVTAVSFNASGNVLPTGGSYAATAGKILVMTNLDGGTWVEVSRT